MKKIMTLVVMMTIVISAAAMSPKEARREARKATDRMDTELRLTKHQYSKVLDINEDYFRALDGRHDDRDLRHRNERLERVLTPEQLNRFYHRSSASNHNKGWRSDRGHKNDRHGRY